MNICPESAKLTALREGWLDADEAARLQGHVDECERCRQVLDDLDEVVGMLADHAGAVDPPPGGYEELMKAALLMRDRIVPLPAGETPRRMWPIVAAAVAAMLAVTTFSIVDPGSRPTRDAAEIALEADIPDFFEEEHALATETLPFSDGASTVLMVSREK